MKLIHIIFLILVLPLMLSCAGPDSGSTDTVAVDVPTKAAALVSDHANVKASLKNFPSSNVVWAVNLGGQRYVSEDGISYQADEFQPSTVEQRIDEIKGAQEPEIYKSYRMGNIRLSRNLPNGRYDIILRFAEPQEVNIGDRVFDVVAEGQVVIPGLDVRLARDGNSYSSLDRTVTDVVVDDGQLNVQLEPIKGEPILSAIVVMDKQLPSAPQWKLIWADEFADSSSIDQSKWNFDIWPAKKVNGEDQSYTSNVDNVRIEDGKLIIEAHYKQGAFTSGRVHTAGKADLLYGRIEVRAKLPSGQGTWPAIWMLPSDPFKYATSCGPDTDWQGNSECDAWPNSGEIDIMEHVGYDPNRVHGTVHTKAFYWVNGEQRKASIETKNAISEFHNYAMEWSPERIDVFFNDVRYFTYLKQSDKWQEWPFDHPFHLILNVAVGGGWGSAGGPTDLTAFPTRMEVDYVRMYKKANTH